MRQALWDQVAYVCRYGKQPLSEILRLSPQDLRDFKQGLGRIVTRENE